MPESGILHFYDMEKYLAELTHIVGSSLGIVADELHLDRQAMPLDHGHVYVVASYTVYQEIGSGQSSEVWVRPYQLILRAGLERDSQTEVQAAAWETQIRDAITTHGLREAPGVLSIGEAEPFQV